MTNIGYIASAAVMGLLLTVVAVALARVGDRGFSTAATNGAPGAGTTDVLSRYVAAGGRAARTPATWYVSFVVLALVSVGGAIALVTSSPEIGGLIGLGMAVGSAAILCVFLFWGIYQSGRYRGLKSAQAAAAGAWALGLLLTAVIVVKLVLAGP